jgi:hypothetical protein
MREHAPTITALTRGGVSGTAQTELNKTLMGEHVGKALRTMRDTGVMAHFLPELTPAIGFDQESKYHDLSLDEHIISVIENLAALNAPLHVRLAALFHDAGKPESAFRGPTGRLHYYGSPEHGKEDHAITGARIAREALGRLNYPAETIGKVARIIEHHMVKPEATTRATRARKWRAEVGPDLVDDVLLHRRADVTAKGEADEEHVRNLERFTDLVHQQADAPAQRADLAIGGKDLIDAGIPPGRHMGAILDDLLKHVIGDPSLNHGEWLIDRARKLARQYGVEGLQEAYVEGQHLRDRVGRWRKMLERMDTITRHDVEAGRVPGLEVSGGLGAGVAGHAGLGGGAIRVARSGFDDEGKISSVLLAHEVGHHLVSHVIVDGKIPPELEALSAGRGRAEGRYGAVAGSGARLFGEHRKLPEEFIADAYSDLIHGRGEFSYVPGLDGPDDPDEREKARKEFEAYPYTKFLRLLSRVAEQQGLPHRGLWKFQRHGDTYRLTRREVTEASWDDHLHPRDRAGRFRLVPRSAAEIADMRVRVYEKRWGADPEAALKIRARADTQQHDDPELLDALEAAMRTNVDHMGADLWDHFGEQPIVLKADLGTDFWGAAARADGTYSAYALRKRPVVNGQEQPSIMDGKGPPRPPKYAVIEKHPATGQRVAYAEEHGVASDADLASVIRHEWFHHVEGQLTSEQMYEYRSLFPRLESGAIDGERIAREVGPNAGANQGETAAEVFAIVTHPTFKANEWPEWVSQAGWAMTELLYQIAEGSRDDPA